MRHFAWIAITSEIFAYRKLNDDLSFKDIILKRRILLYISFALLWTKINRNHLKQISFNGIERLYST